jgi:protein FAM32A
VNKPHHFEVFLFIPLIMPSSDYTASSGALKLKGSGVVKKKKKKPKPGAVTQALEKAANEKDVVPEEGKEDPKETSKETISSSIGPSAKTEAQIRFEENRRRRLEEKLEKEGGKTHKERVEELNNYLSKLSDHNDM